MTRPYISLHNHTTYSIGDSLISPKQLFSKTEELGQTAVAVTDHGSCAGLWESFQVSKKSNVKLIAGCECYFVNDASNNDDTSLRHIILLAKNATGYKNLLTINKRGFDQMTMAFKKAVSRVDWKLLEQFSEGLICTSACGNGVIGQFIMADRYDDAKAAAKRFKDIFGDSFTLELQAHHLQIRQSPYSGPVNQQKINLALKKIAQELDIRCIVTTDAHYVLPEHHRAHDVYLCNSSGQPISSGNRLKYDKHEFYIRNADSLYSHFERHLKIWGDSFVNSLFENTEYYAEQCEKSEWIDPAVATGLKNQLPTFPVKDEPDYDKFIEWQKESKFYNANLAEDANFYRYRSEIGLEQKISTGKIKEEDRDKCYEQMKEEFDVLEYRNFSSYMLIVAGFLKWCRDNEVPIGPGRGSVGGSLTAYLTGIHQANPFLYNMIFARFLNKYKAAFPDVDSDVSGADRDKVLKYMSEKYGSANVAHVSNINTITPKVYARDISRIFEFGGEGRSKAAEIGDAIADSIPAEIHSVKSALTDAPLFAEYAKQYPELAEFAELLNGLPRAWSTHAGGIVVSQSPLEQIVPVRKDTEGESCIALAKNDIEEASCIKLDLLGLETLDIIRETERLAKQNGKQIPEEFNYEFVDENVYEMIANGDTYGVFQLDGTAVHVCKKIKPKNISDIAIITALIRPSSKDIIDDFVKARNGETKVELLHPKLERALGKTYGFGLFEESLLYLALDIAGWDLYDADKLRKLTKEKGKNPEKIQQWKKEFIEGATKNGIDVGERVWNEVIESFQGYGFNISHATLYSMISYKCAYLKYHYPVEFFTALLKSKTDSNAKNASEKMTEIKNKLRELKIKIVPPDVNTSTLSWSIVDDNTVMTGLDALKFMGTKAIPELIEKRPFKSFKDLIQRTESSKVTASAIQAMAASGSLDCFGMDRKLMYIYASDYRAKLKAHIEKSEKVWIKEYAKNNSLTKKRGETVYKDSSGNIVEIPLASEDWVRKYCDSFNYPFPEEKPWTLQEMFAFEEYYMGEGISGDNFDRYPRFFDRNKTVPFEAVRQMFPYKVQVEDDERSNRKANTHYLGNVKMRPLEAIIVNVFSFIVKKEDSKIFGQEMARITIQDPWGDESTMLCFPEAWLGFKDRIKELNKGLKIDPGLAIKFLGSFQWENDHTNSFILTEILDVKGPPVKPEDESKKVKMPRGSSYAYVKSEDVEEISKDELLERLEGEAIDDGVGSIEDEE